MKFNSAPGQWSSFWLQSPTIGDPRGDPEEAGVEMDVVEHRVQCMEAPAPTPPQTCGPDSAIADRVQHGLIWDGYGAAQQSAIKLSEPLAGLGNGSWHTWALNWSPTRVGVLLRRQGDLVAERTHLPPRPAHHPELRGRRVLRRRDPGVRVRHAPDEHHEHAGRLRARVGDARRARRWPRPRPWCPAARAWARRSRARAARGRGFRRPRSAASGSATGRPIAGAAAPAYTVQPGDGGHALSCRVTAANLAGTVGSDSNAVSIPASPVPPTAPLIPSPPPPPPPAPFVFARPVDRGAPLATITGARSQMLGTTVARPGHLSRRALPRQRDEHDPGAAGRQSASADVQADDGPVAARGHGDDRQAQALGERARRDPAGAAVAQPRHRSSRRARQRQRGQRPDAEPAGRAQAPAAAIGGALRRVRAPEER